MSLRAHPTAEMLQQQLLLAPLAVSFSTAAAIAYILFTLCHSMMPWSSCFTGPGCYFGHVPCSPRRQSDCVCQESRQAAGDGTCDTYDSYVLATLIGMSAQPSSFLLQKACRHRVSAHTKLYGARLKPVCTISRACQPTLQQKHLWMYLV